MSRSKQLWEITRWELMRWLKLKDQIQTLLLSTVLGLAIWGGMAYFQKANQGVVEVAVLGQEKLPFVLPQGGEIEIVDTAGRSEEQLRQALEDGELDALLRIDSVDSAALLVTREPVWKAELEAALSASRGELRRAASGIEPGVLADLFAPVDLQVAYHEGAARPRSLAEKVLAGVMIGLMMLGVFVGLAYQFVVITGEKQLRVTEQIVSAVSPQMWIDGKILGISLFSLVATGTYVVSGLVFVLFSRLFGVGLDIPLAVTDPLLWIEFLLLALAGFLLWNTFFGLIAATIDDPNTSARGSFIMVPLLPLIIAFMGMSNPDTLLMRVLSIVPPTSPSVLIMRLVLTEVALWEVALALVLLVGAIWLLRKAAGKIFGLAILMYGKEPSWREMARWVREA
ncbi:MAG: ABC transporter permease [Acidobacteriota bacterium]